MREDLLSIQGEGTLQIHKESWVPNLDIDYGDRLLFQTFVNRNRFDLLQDFQHFARVELKSVIKGQKFLKKMQ